MRKLVIGLIVLVSTTFFPLSAIAAEPTIEYDLLCSCAGSSLPEISMESKSNIGPMITVLQEQLILLGLNPGTVDGSYGQGTQEAVKVFQILRGMKPTGVFNQDDWCELYQALAEQRLEDVDPSSDVSIIIDRGTRTLTVRVGQRFHKQYRVAVGTYSTPTPLGDWQVIHKGVAWGSGFGTRWMGLNVPWGIFGVHGTNNPGSIGSYASHGCIRMFNQCVEELYPMVPPGTSVRIVDSSLPSPPPLPKRELKAGIAGQDVVYLQWRLKALGLPIAADGRFGSKTVWALKYFQVVNCIPATGIYDQKTVEALKAFDQCISVLKY